jgi:toxin ParE1/3/4
MRLVYTTTARGRLKSILAYIKEHHSKERSVRFRKEILDRSQELIDHPAMGHPLDISTSVGRRHRGLALGRYLIVYPVEADTIYVTDFFDTKQHPSGIRG